MSKAPSCLPAPVVKACSQNQKVPARIPSEPSILAEYAFIRMKGHFYFFMITSAALYSLFHPNKSPKTHTYIFRYNIKERSDCVCSM
ncbi:hypothetical protein XELAEV_18028663mg [Xenopus laevis]|uniref:Uncharacterized protein n=1 Tax=Xenopus laevis TaxID=8355 RepID=A0A974CRU9_XENLA|nr:hypothetical protein XELAEV_18028663mg [Xenopus laevis]